MTRVIYGKIGRSMIIEPRKFGPVGGDNEPLALLRTLADRHPDTEFVVGCRWTGSQAAINDLPKNITLPTIPKVTPRNRYKDGERIYDGSQKPWESLEKELEPYFLNADGVIMWAGQMGTSNVPIPRVENPADVTNPQDSFMAYVGPITLNINRWRDVDPIHRQEVWLCADARNYLKARDLKWPPAPVIAQHRQTQEQKHYRWGDWNQPANYGFTATWDHDAEGKQTNVWVTKHEYAYGALEIVGIPAHWNSHAWRDWSQRQSFGILINEARSYVGNDRASIMRDWVVKHDILEAGAIRGKWSPAGVEKAGLGSVAPLRHDMIADFLTSYKSTFTTPSSGSGWATTKWWEAAGLGTICFCHPKWDDQGHIIPTIEAVDAGVLDDRPELKHLVRWLRVASPEDLAAKVAAVNSSREVYEWLRDKQYELWLHAMTEQRAVRDIESRILAWKETEDEGTGTSSHS